MKAAAFQELLQGVREGGACLRGELKPARTFRVRVPAAAVLLSSAAALSSCVSVGGVSMSDVRARAAAETARCADGGLDAVAHGAQLGSAMADFALGNEFEEEKPERAAEFYRKAAEFGLPEAQFNLGVLYRLGRGVPQDYAESAKWFRRSAEQGFPNAQYNLGVSYVKGEGVPESYRDAYIWFSLAGVGGHEQGEAAALKTLSQFPTRADLHAAQAEGRRIHEEIQNRECGGKAGG